MLCCLARRLDLLLLSGAAVLDRSLPLNPPRRKARTTEPPNPRKKGKRKEKKKPNAFIKSMWRTVLTLAFHECTRLTAGEEDTGRVKNWGRSNIFFFSRLPQIWGVSTKRPIGTQ